MKKYFPIFLSKDGELNALANLAQNVKNEITPIIQVLNESYDKIESAFLNKWVFSNNSLYLDFSLCSPFDHKKTQDLISKLIIAGINVTPVFEAKSPAIYASIIRNLYASNKISNVCIRFSNNSGNFINIDSQISSLLTTLGISKNKTSVLLDFGFIDKNNYNVISTVAHSVISGINNIANYNGLIISSSSFPESLTSLTPPGKVYRLQRYEWNIWQTLKSDPAIANYINYSDYGTKHPFYNPNPFAGSCSIKYTLPDEYLIFRGEISKNHKEGNGQYIIFANMLINSADYFGVSFSWGDNEINFYGQQSLSNPNRKTGNAKNWVIISQNHHITLLHGLL